MMQRNRWIKFALTLAVAAIVTVMGMHMTAEPAQAQFGDVFGNCVPWCDGDGPVQQVTWEGTDLYIHNKSSQDIWVAMLYFQEGDPSSSCLAVVGADCAANDRWILSGWYKVPAFLEERIISNYDNQYVYLYAEGSEGEEWSGSDVHRYVVNSSMRTASSLSNASGSYQAGFFKVDLGNRSDTYTLTLDP